MTSRNGNKIANQFVIENGSTTVFQSYNSMIATIDRATKTILVGADVTKEEAAEIKSFLEDKYSDVDVDMRDGGQPVYSFLIGVE